MTYTFLKNTKGKWFLQENYYLLNTKKRRGYKKRCHFLLDLNQILDKDIDLKIGYKELHTTNKKSNNLCIDNSLSNSGYYFRGIKSNFGIHAIRNNLFRVSKQNDQRKIFHQEYIYLVNKNFMISVTSLKTFKKDRFLGVKISSYIRKLCN